MCFNNICPKTLSPLDNNGDSLKLTIIKTDYGLEVHGVYHGEPFKVSLHRKDYILDTFTNRPDHHTPITHDVLFSLWQIGLVKDLKYDEIGFQFILAE